MVSKRVSNIGESVIHEMTRLAGLVNDPAMLSWAKPTTGTPGHINEGAIKAIRDGSTGGYSTNQGLPELRKAIVDKLKKDNNIEVDISSFTGSSSDVQYVEFFIDGVSKMTDSTAPYGWTLSEQLFGTHEIKVTAYSGDGPSITKTIDAMIFIF